MSVVIQVRYIETLVIIKACRKQNMLLVWLSGLLLTSHWVHSNKSKIDPPSTATSANAAGVSV